ncbi:MAG: hypothetical protein ABIJ09_16010 [Pseudomonadota bacterium]
MRLWRIQTGRRLAPFGESVGELIVAPETLARQQERTCARLGIELEDVSGLFPLEVGPGLILFDDAFVNEAALDHFVQHTHVPGTAALCLGDDALGRFVQPGLGGETLSGQAAVVGLFVVDHRVVQSGGVALWQQLVREARPVLLGSAPSERERLPGFPSRQPVLEIPRGQAVAARLTLWPQLLWLNQALAYARDPARERSGNQIAGDARVHPTAHIEHSSIGPRTVIEAHATVHDSILGAECHLGDHSALTGCVLGDGCQTLAGSLLRRVVAFPGATLSSLGLDEVLVGRRSFLTTASIFFATRLGENPEVEIDGSEVDCGRPRLGGCVGHDVVLGARAIFEPARVIPNGATVVMRPEEGVARIEIEAGDVCCWDQGSLRRVDRVFPSHQPPELDDNPEPGPAAAARETPR